MDQVQAIYEKLKMKHPEINLIYDGPKGLLWYTNDDCSIEITKVQRGFNARFGYNGRCYDVVYANENEVRRVLRLMKKGKVYVEEDPLRPKHAKIVNALEPKKNKQSVSRKIAPTIIGLAIIVFSALMLYGGYEHIQSQHGVVELSDYGLIVLFLGCLYAGVGLIRYTFGRLVYGGMNFFGVLVASFGLCELFYGFVDIGKDGYSMGNAIGVSIVFLLIIGAGVGLIFASHTKRRYADLVVKRTPILPPQVDIERIFDRMKDDSTSTAYMISIGDGEPEYTGSRVGGEPYSDGSKTGPDLDIVEGVDFVFLFQINLRDIRGETELPHSGILQFYLLDAAGVETVQIRTVYYPYINDMLINSPGMSKPIRLTPKECPDMSSSGIHDMNRVRQAAYELGIPLEEDLDWWELFGDMAPETTHGCYLLGPAKLPEPYTEAVRPRDRQVNHPLLMLNPEDESTYDMLLQNEGDYEHLKLQVFMSLYNMQHLESTFPEDTITIHGYQDDSVYGRWSFK